MRTIAFLGPVVLGRGGKAVHLHHEWLDLPEANAEELRRTHPREVVDVTPSAFTRAVGVTHQQRHSSLHIVPCRCAGQKRLTACPMCRGSGKLMAL